jgi:ribonucleoside-diphosphate reductase alpha chain
MRFLSGTQLDLFTGLSAAAAVPVLGTVSAPANRVDLNSGAQQSLTEQFEDRTAPQAGIAPDLAASSGLTQNPTETPHLEDRGIYHAADAMRSMVDMGDSPSCATCGAIMTRNGSCYRCMECGSTSGCS